MWEVGIFDCAEEEEEEEEEEESAMEEGVFGTIALIVNCLFRMLNRDPRSTIEKDFSPEGQN